MPIVHIPMTSLTEPILAGDLKFKSGTGYVLTLDHSATADRTITFPDATDTVALLAATQTLTNKTLTSPTIQGTVSAGTGLTMPAFTAGGDIAFGDGIKSTFGGVASLQWDTADPNANLLKVELPSGGAIDVPAVLFGIGIHGVDLGIFDGLTQPRVGVVDADRDSWIAIGHRSDDEAAVMFGHVDRCLRMYDENTFEFRKTTGVGNLRVSNFQAFNWIRLDGNGVYLHTAAVNDYYAPFKARQNTVGYKEVARLQNAAEPRFQHTLPLNLGDDKELTISTGAITVGVAAGAAFYRVDTEGDAATDDLDTINGGKEGDIIVLKAEDSARTVVVKHGTGNLQLNAQADFSMDNANDVIILIYDGTNWLEISRSNNGA